MCVGKRDCVLYLLLRFRVLLHYQYLHASKKPHILQVYVIVYWDLILVLTVNRLANAHLAPLSWHAGVWCPSDTSTLFA